MSTVEVAAGTVEARRRSVGSFRISELGFAGGGRMRRHAHPLPCVAVVVGGGVRKTYATETQLARRSTVIVMPADEPHEDAFSDDGACLVVVESGEELWRDAFEDWRAVELAHRIGHELAAPDAFTELALEGLALELTVIAQRAAARDRVDCPWLDAAAEILRERYRDPPTAVELAHDVGVHPAQLARRFRARFGESVGSYARNARLDWAAHRLVRTDTALARIACEAGFADQSHFTRAFARRFGIPPGRYRAAHR